MKLKEISVVLARTINLGNYESMRIEGGAIAMLEEGDDMEKVREAIIKDARATLNAAYLNLKPKADK